MNAAERRQFLEERQRGLGGSDIAAILGVSPYKTAVSVYVEKTSPIKDEPPNAVQQRGIDMEPVVAAWYERETGNIVRTPDKPFMVHLAHPFLVAHPDRFAEDPKTGAQTGLECKTSHPMAAKDFGENGTDQVPHGYILQCQHYMLVTGYDRWDLAVWIGLDDHRWYTINRNEKLINLIIREAGRFWSDFVLPRKPPPPDSSEATKELLRHLYPDNIVVETIATPEILKECEYLAELRTKRKELDDNEEFVKHRIQAYMGEAGTLIAPDGALLATWKKTKDSKRTDWKAACDEAAVHKAIIENNTKVVEGSRRFLLKLGDKGDN